MHHSKLILILKINALEVQNPRPTCTRARNEMGGAKEIRLSMLFDVIGVTT